MRIGMTAAAATLACLGGASMPQDDSGYPLRYVDVLHETFFIATPAARGLTHRLDWTEIRARVDDRWMLQFTNLQMPDRQIIDETFVQYQDGTGVMRAGKLRSGFGFGSWSDLFYNVVSRQPMVRLLPVLDGYSLLNFGSGVEYKGHARGIEYGLAATDSSLSARQVLPDKIDVFQGRVQIPMGDVMVGLNAANVASGSLGQGGQVLGVDYWTILGRWSIKGEAIGSLGSGQRGGGYYTDLSYRITHPWRPHVGFRIEEYASGGDHHAVLTPGIRIVPVKELAFGLNYGFKSPVKLLRSGGGSVASGGGYGGGGGFDYGSSLEGWSFQGMITFRFRA